MLTNGSIGTNTDSGLTDLGLPTYLSGFDMHVGGKAGMIKSLDSFVGNVTVSRTPGAPSLDGVPYEELDIRGPANFDPWDSATFGADPLVNDSIASGAQFLGPIDANGTVQVDGEMQALLPESKPQSYYAVPLMAGQTVTVQLTSTAFTPTGNFDIGVFDAEQRLVATDFSNVDANQTEGQPFQVTATTPGVYYFAVTGPANPTFSSSILLGPFAPYTLTISNVGDIGLAAVAATNNILDLGGTTGASSGVVGGFDVASGDLGAIYSTGLIISDDIGQVADAEGITGALESTTIAVRNGNLRAVQSGSIGNGVNPGATDSTGFQTGVSFEEPVSGYIPNGSVGMLQATSTANATGQGATGMLAWNEVIDTVQIGTGALGELTSSEAAAVAIGGDYEMVQASNFFYGDLIAKGNIGSIRAGSMATPTASYFQVNATDDLSKHGVIDLIDVDQSLGILGVGGPAITTGPGGNVQLGIHVEPHTLSPQTAPTVFRDLAFGGGQPESTLYQPGETATITDDSGSLVTITPGEPRRITQHHHLSNPRQRWRAAIAPH